MPRAPRRHENIRRRARISTFRRQVPFLNRAIKNQLGKAIETKDIEVAQTQTVDVLNNPLFVELYPGITQGTADGERLGNKIFATSTKLNLELEVDDGTLNAQARYRVMVVQKKKTDLAVGDMPSTTMALPNDEIMKVLYDRTFCMTTNSLNIAGTGFVGFCKSLNLRFIWSRYRQVKRELWYASDVSTTPENGLILYVLGSNADCDVHRAIQSKYKDA